MTSRVPFFSQVEDHCCKLAKKGLTPSQIGVILRDSHGIAQVGSVTGSKVLRILKGKGEQMMKIATQQKWINAVSCSDLRVNI